MNNTSGYFMEPQNFSVNDGNGIRTIIFFAGCPLRCEWCSNPEGYTCSLKIAHYEKTCIKCGRCQQICANNIGNNLNNPYEREKCVSCGFCVNVCPTNSRKNLIYHYTVEEILQIIEKQKIFYRHSGGGVTFSGGEATLQANILRKLIYKLYDKAIDMALETSGCFDFDNIKDILKKLDLIFVDIKLMNDDKHKLYTGTSNKKILENISKLNQLNVDLVVRIPIVYGVNSDIENIRKTAKFVKNNIDIPKMELLPYHSFGDAKYEALGLDKPSENFKAPTQKYLEELYRVVENEGVKIVSYK